MKKLLLLFTFCSLSGMEEYITRSPTPDNVTDAVIHQSGLRSVASKEDLAVWIGRLDTNDFNKLSHAVMAQRRRRGGNKVALKAIVKALDHSNTIQKKTLLTRQIGLMIEEKQAIINEQSVLWQRRSMLFSVISFLIGATTNVIQWAIAHA